MKNIIKEAVFGLVLCIIAAFLPFLLMLVDSNHILYLNLGSIEQVIGVAIIAFITSLLVVLTRICLPFDKYKVRIFVFGIIAVVGLFIVLAVVSLKGKGSLIQIIFGNLSPLNIFEGLLVAAVICTFYLGIVSITRLVRKEKSNANI